MPRVDHHQVGVILKCRSNAPPAAAAVSEPMSKDQRRSISPAHSIHVEGDVARHDIELIPPSCHIARPLTHHAYASGAGPWAWGRISSSRRSTSSVRAEPDGARSASLSCSTVRGPTNRCRNRWLMEQPCNANGRPTTRRVRCTVAPTPQAAVATVQLARAYVETPAVPPHRPKARQQADRQPNGLHGSTPTPYASHAGITSSSMVRSTRL